jgi:hypothetical protein
MAYQDQLNAINQYGSYLNYGQGTYGVNPYSSGAYLPSIYNVYSQHPLPPDPFAPYQQRTREEQIMTQIGMGSMGLQLGKPVGDVLSKGIGSTFAKDFGKGWGGSKVGLGKRFEGFNLAAPMAVYGATRDMDPYTYTGKRKKPKTNMLKL